MNQGAKGLGVYRGMQKKVAPTTLFRETHVEFAKLPVSAWTKENAKTPRLIPFSTLCRTLNPKP